MRRQQARRGVMPQPQLGAILFTAIVAVAIGLLLDYVDPLHALSSSPAEEMSSPSVDMLEAPTPVPELLHSRFYTRTVDPIIYVGEVADITLQFRNIGHTPWVRGTPAEIRLGVVGEDPLPPHMRVDWLYWDRPTCQTEAIVLDGGLVTFSFQVKGVAPGDFRLNLRPVVDGVTWLEDDDVHVDITVRRVHGSGGTALTDTSGD